LHGESAFPRQAFLQRRGHKGGHVAAHGSPIQGAAGMWPFSGSAESCRSGTTGLKNCHCGSFRNGIWFFGEPRRTRRRSISDSGAAVEIHLRLAFMLGSCRGPDGAMVYSRWDVTNGKLFVEKLSLRSPSCGFATRGFGVFRRVGAKGSSVSKIYLSGGRGYVRPLRRLILILGDREGGAEIKRHRGQSVFSPDGGKIFIKRGKSGAGLGATPVFYFVRRHLPGDEKRNRSPWGPAGLRH